MSLLGIYYNYFINVESLNREVHERADKVERFYSSLSHTSTQAYTSLQKVMVSVLCHFVLFLSLKKIKRRKCKYEMVLVKPKFSYFLSYSRANAFVFLAPVPKILARLVVLYSDIDWSCDYIYTNIILIPFLSLFGAGKVMIYHL